MWGDPTEAKNFEPTDSQGFISPQEVVFLPSANVLTHPEILPFPLVNEEINPLLSSKAPVTFCE